MNFEQNGSCDQKMLLYTQMFQSLYNFISILAVGKTAMSTEDIANKNKGIGVENYHYLNDGLWNMKEIKA